MTLKTLQKTGLGLFFLLIIISCTNKEKQQLLELREENNSLKEQIDYSIRNALYKDHLISSIDYQLDRIDSSFIYLNTHTEDELFDKQANKIFVQLDNIKKKIDHAEDSLRNAYIRNNQLINENNSLLQVIERYKLKVLVKEKQILELKRKIKQQSGTIEEQKIAIEKANDEINIRIKEIEHLEYQIIKTEAQAYERLSNELRYVAHNLPRVKGWFTKRSKEDIAKTRTRLVNEAKSYKEKANSLRVKYNN